MSYITQTFVFIPESLRKDLLSRINHFRMSFSAKSGNKPDKLEEKLHKTTNLKSVVESLSF